MCHNDWLEFLIRCVTTIDWRFLYVVSQRLIDISDRLCHNDWLAFLISCVATIDISNRLCRYDWLKFAIGCVTVIGWRFWYWYRYVVSQRLIDVCNRLCHKDWLTFLIGCVIMIYWRFWYVVSQLLIDTYTPNRYSPSTPLLTLFSE